MCPLSSPIDRQLALPLMGRKTVITQDKVIVNFHQFSRARGSYVLQDIFTLNNKQEQECTLLYILQPIKISKIMNIFTNILLLIIQEKEVRFYKKIPN